MQPATSTAANSATPIYGRRANDMTPEAWTGLVGGLMQFLGEEVAEPEHAADQDKPRDAAGIVFCDPDGAVLLLKRSAAEPNYAGHWALPGGGAEPGETPEQAADREAVEEIGPFPDGRKTLLSSVQTPTGMIFHTFHQQVPQRFIPKLNGEHTEHIWRTLDNLPEPIHPGVERQLESLRTGAVAQDYVSGISTWSADITRQNGEHERAHVMAFSEGEARAQLESQFRYSKINNLRKIETSAPAEKRKKGFDAEEEDDERGQRFAALGHAGDSALRIALDRDSVRSFDQDGRLRVEVAHICKANICPYRGEEIPGFEELGLEPDKVYQLLRDPGELERAVESANTIQIMKKHVPVSADDPQQWDTVGATGSTATWNDPYIDNSLVVWVKDAIDDIESEEKRELSPGYHYVPDMTPGTWNGEPYDGVMRDIKFNHVALVEQGRQGTDIVVGDSAAEINWTFLEQALQDLFVDA